MGAWKKLVCRGGRRGQRRVLMGGRGVQGSFAGLNVCSFQVLSSVQPGSRTIHSARADVNSSAAWLCASAKLQPEQSQPWTRKVVGLQARQLNGFS